MKTIKFLIGVYVLLISINVSAQSNSALSPVLSSYMALKDALVKSDGSTASSLASQLVTTLDAVKMEDLSGDAHVAWMKYAKDLKADAEQISQANDIANQRNRFISLSTNMHEVVKVASTGTTVYYQFCPMANKGKGAHWLSLEDKVKNPYYGNQMPTCGKVVEKIK